MPSMTTARLNGRRITRLRQQWRPRVTAGECVCRRCGKVIRPDPSKLHDGWDLGHLHDLALGGKPRGPMVPEHASCNRADGARLGLALRPRARRRPAAWLS